MVQVLTCTFFLTLPVLIIASHSFVEVAVDNPPLYGTNNEKSTLLSPEYLYYPITLDYVSIGFNIRANTSLPDIYVVKMVVQVGFLPESNCDTDYLTVDKIGLHTERVLKCCGSNCTNPVELLNEETAQFNVMYNSRHTNKGFNITYWQETNPCRNSGRCVTKYDFTTGHYTIPLCNCITNTSGANCTEVEYDKTAKHGGIDIKETLLSPEYNYNPNMLDYVTAIYSIRANRSFDDIVYVVRMIVNVDFLSESDCDTDYLTVDKIGLHAGRVLKCCGGNCSNGVDLLNEETTLFNVVYNSRHKNKGFNITYWQGTLDSCTGGDLKCLNGGTCQTIVKRNVKSAVCNCPFPFTGNNCGEVIGDVCSNGFCDPDNVDDSQGIFGCIPVNSTCYRCACTCSNCDNLCNPGATSDSDVYCPDMKRHPRLIT